MKAAPVSNKLRFYARKQLWTDLSKSVLNNSNNLAFLHFIFRKGTRTHLELLILSQELECGDVIG